jgi:putative membrane protein
VPRRSTTDSPTAGHGPFFARPFLWAVFALVLLAIPAAGFLAESAMTWEEIHPAINAMLNATSAVFLILGWRAIKAKKVDLHRACMITAFSASSIFLVSYLVRFAISGAHRYPGDSWDKTLYFVILFSHMTLAFVTLPLAIRTLYLGLKKRFIPHRRIAKWAWPIWVYVSVTGLLVYLMLYPIASRVHGP